MSPIEPRSSTLTSTTIEVSPGRSVPEWLLLTLVCVGQFMVVLDISIVNVALPSIQKDLHFSTSGLQWVVNAYTLTFAGFMLLGGRAADLFGRRRIFLSGLTLFTMASMLAVFHKTRGCSLLPEPCRDSAPPSSPRRP